MRNFTQRWFIVICLISGTVNTEDTLCSAGQYRCFYDSECIPMEKFCDDIPDCTDNTDESNCENECLSRHDIFGEHYKGRRQSGIPVTGNTYINCTTQCRGEADIGLICKTWSNQTVFCDVPFCGSMSAKDVNCEFQKDFCGYTILDRANNLDVLDEHYVWEDMGIVSINVSKPMKQRKLLMASKILTIPDATKSVCVQIRYNVGLSRGRKDSYWRLKLALSDLCSISRFSPENCTDCVMKCSANTSITKQAKVRVEMQIERKTDAFISGKFSLLYIQVTRGECNDSTEKLIDECTDDEFKCDDLTCIPLVDTCDGYGDCPDNSDELFCRQYLKCGDDEIYCEYANRCVPQYKDLIQNLTDICQSTFFHFKTPSLCPNDFTCKGYNNNCLSTNEVCDGKPQCVHGDDEIGCVKNCPRGCTCRGLSFESCPSDSLPDIPLIAAHIDLSGKDVNISLLCQGYRTLLVKLNLSNTGIDDVTCLSSNLVFPALRILDLSFNNITILYKLQFPSLEKLYLDHNPIQRIESKLSFTSLSLSNCDLNHLEWENAGSISNGILSAAHTSNQSEIYPFLYYMNNLCYLRKLDLSSNRLSHFGYFGECQSLVSLDLSFNTISSLSFHSFNGLILLERLDLSHNKLPLISREYFQEMYEVKLLNLSNNKIAFINEKSFIDLWSLIRLDLSRNNIKKLDFGIFENQNNLLYLYLENNGLSKISRTRASLESLQLLNLRGNSIVHIPNGFFETLNNLKTLDISGNLVIPQKSTFNGLGVLRYMNVDSFVLCCIRPVSVEESNCKSPNDIFSSCANLIDFGILHVCIWFTAALSLTGNMFALIARIRKGTWIHESRDVLVTNLCISDFLMGIYLIIVAYMDVQTRGQYGLHHNEWKRSVLCKIAGVLVSVSSEASTLCILAITMDRYILFRNPLSLRKQSLKSAYITVALIWILSILVATLPFSWRQNEDDNFYGRSSVCISLPLTKRTLTFKGWEYSFAVFIGLNLFIYLGVVIGQIVIYKQILAYNTCVKSDKKKQREIAVAKSLSAVVISDTLCWLPIAIIGCMAIGGVDISNDVYAWIIVFVLPLNSAINPFLYTLTSYRKQQVRNTSTEKSTQNFQIALVRPLRIPVSGLQSDDPRGGMIIAVKQSVSANQLIDVWFSDQKGWKAKSTIVKVLDNIIHCDVPPYKHDITEPKEISLELTFIKERRISSQVSLYYIPEECHEGRKLPCCPRKLSV